MELCLYIRKYQRIYLSENMDCNFDVVEAGVEPRAAGCQPFALQIEQHDHMKIEKWSIIARGHLTFCHI